MDTSLQAQSNLTVNRTRYGRISKPPERYVPVEKVEDDYGMGDYDSSDSSNVDSDVEYESEEYDEDDDADADEDGNLKDFVVPDKSESDNESTNGGTTAGGDSTD